MADEQLALAVSEYLPQPKNPELENEIGLYLNLPFTQPFNTPDGMKNEIYWAYEEGEPTVRQLHMMRRCDPQARALYRLITLPIRSAFRAATFIPADDGEEEAEFIEQMLTLPVQSGGMSTSFQQSMSHLLMAVFDGFAAFEQVYQVPQAGPLKGKITLRKLAYRPSETITFLVDDNGGFAGLRQRTQFKGENRDVVIPKDRSLYYASNEEERPFYGVSYFQAAYQSHVQKLKLYYLMHLAAQHRAVGVRYGKIPKTASTADKNSFKRGLQDFGIMQAMMLPEGFEVETVYPGAAANFLEIVNHHNSQMSKSVLAPFFDDSQGGDSALVDFGKQSDAMFLMMLQSIMDEVANVINTYLIPKFVDWNFGSDKYPKFQWGPFTDEQKQAINDTFDKLATSGQSMNVSKEFMFELEKHMADELGLEVDFDKVEAAMEEQEQLMKEQQFGDQSAFGSFVKDLGSATGQEVPAEETGQPPAGPPGPNAK